jgi:hypothetical protein
MTELHNPLFEEEKEFLERKKLEYERALRGDVEHLKDQSVMVGKVALVGAGLLGTVWLIGKALSSRKRRRYQGPDEPGADDAEDEGTYFTSGSGKRYKSKLYHKSAADSAQAFMQNADGDDTQGFGMGASAAKVTVVHPANHSAPDTPHFSSFQAGEEDPFQDLPYDDSRRLPVSHDFDDDEDDDREPRPSMVGTALQSFLQSDTGKIIVAQVAAVALALVTKKLNEFFPAAKNSDLATSPGYAPVETGFSPVASSVSPTSPDASFYSQPL